MGKTRAPAAACGSSAGGFAKRPVVDYSPQAPRDRGRHKTAPTFRAAQRPPGPLQGGTMVTRSISKLAGLAALALALVASGPVAAQYPERPITIIVPWGAGGGTDATGRILASMLERELGVPVSVVNRTGGSGVVGHSAIATAAPDGYTLGVVTVEIGMMHWQGLTELNYESFTPLALYNEDPAGLQVRSDSEWGTAQDVLDAVKASPGEHKSSGTGQGGIWHLALAGMLQEADIDPGAAPWVPS